MRLSPILLLAACRGHEKPHDVDHDGVTALRGDCDDQDPSVNPKASEIPYDSVDQDCDPSDDAALSFGRIPLTAGKDHAAGPRLASADGVVQANLVYANGLDASAWSMATWDGSTTRGLLEDQVAIQSDNLKVSLGRVLDAAILPDGTTLLALSLTTDAGNLRASLLRVSPDDSWTWSGYGPTGVTQPFRDVALSYDGTVASVVGCSDQGLWLISGTFDEIDALEADEAYSTDPGVGCEVQGAEVRALGRGRTVTAYTADAGALVATGQTWSDVLDFQWEPEGMLLMRADGLTIETGSGAVEVPTSDDLVLARFDVAPDGEAFVAWADADGGLWLSYGPLEGPFARAFLGEDLATSDLDVEATDDAVFVAARSGKDAWIAGTPRP